MATAQTSIPSARRQAVDKARKAWIGQLIDLSRRNNLLYYRSLKDGTLDLAEADPATMATLLSGGAAVPLTKLLGTDESALIREIGRRAQANAEEKGLQTLFLALGTATWPEEDGGRAPAAPVLLVPMALETRGSHNYSLARAGSVQVNPVLLFVLESKFGVKFSAEELIRSHLLGDDEGESFDAVPLYDELRKHANDVPGFAISSSAMVANFAFQKMAMVKDLEERGEELASHDMVAAIAGDNDARAAVNSSAQNADPGQLDRVPPDNEFLVLDADSSQQCAITNVLMGQSSVIHGPPGTGKSQTIANLITSLAAAGHRVLFVAEKRAALEVVLQRLTKLELGHLAIDLHGADLTPRKVMSQVAAALDRVRTAASVDANTVHQQLVDRRDRLNDHVRRLHSKRQPTGLSLYEMQGRLLRGPESGRSSTRWQGEQLARLTTDRAAEIHDLLLEAAGFEPLFLRLSSSPWTGVRLRDGASVEGAQATVARATTKTLPALKQSVAALSQRTGIFAPVSIQDTKELTALLVRVQSILALYQDAIYKRDIPRLRQSLGPGKIGGIAAIWAMLTNSAYRQARKEVLALRTDGEASVPTLSKEIEEIESQILAWKARAGAGSVPCLHPNLNTAIFSDIDSLASLFPNRQIEKLPLEQLESFLSALNSDRQTPHELPKLSRIEDTLAGHGASPLVEEIRQRKPAPRDWSPMFDDALYNSAIDAAAQSDPEIRGFKGSTHSSYVGEFAQLDQERIKLAAERVRREHAVRVIEAMNAHPDQQHLIKAEALKKSRHLPLRKVFAQASEVLTAVCPCWMASPLSVSQLLDGGKQYFDFVIFDEASQVLPEDAIPSILRGRRLVVAGDNKQLPPTTFFAAADESESVSDEDAAPTEGFESLLDMVIPFVRNSYLDWHYRSRDESLINFSNNHIYGGRLVTFPGPGGPPAISHELVPHIRGKDGEEESSSAEVRRVVDLTIRHAREHPDKTLGVITMGIKHMNRVQAALDREVENHPELDAFFDATAQERFFVKNLERVQGDERDAIILSIGYGKDRAGNLPFRFGPLLSEGGRRRLNVAITRARSRVTVVSSFSYSDIDLARVRAGSGVELLRNYLQYAASGGKRLGDVDLTTVPMNGFEAEIFDVLTASGMKLVPQVGASHFRIDMAAEHPTKPGRFVLAIECDGATYHSSYTARDRDRLRQHQLENLGWRFHRIWSTDWFLRRQEEVKRTILAFHEAVEQADRDDRRQPEPDALAPQETSEPVDAQPAEKQRAPRPQIPRRESINDYSQRDLVQLLEWISSDDHLRTDEELLSEMVPTLGFTRKGPRIEAAIRSALQTYRSGRR